jgi:hypothetical protein
MLRNSFLRQHEPKHRRHGFSGLLVSLSASDLPVGHKARVMASSATVVLTPVRAIPSRHRVTSVSLR